MAGTNACRHELAEALWMHDDSVLDAPEGLDPEYGVILNVVDRMLEHPEAVLTALGMWKEGPVGHRGDHAVEHWFKEVR